MTTRTRAGIRYYLNYCMKVIAVTCLILLALFSGIAYFTHGWKASGIFGTLQIVVLILGCQAVGGPYRFLLQNGYSRQQIVRLLILGFVIDAAFVMSLMTIELIFDHFMAITPATNLALYKGYFQHSLVFQITIVLGYFVETLLYSSIGFLFASLWVRLSSLGKWLLGIIIVALIIVFNTLGATLQPIFAKIMQILLGLSTTGANPWPLFATSILLTYLCYLGARQLLLGLQLRR
ncbi:hypothetical protein [Loigolactobacillus backii]|uniref:Uncharacterized protein n=1 Tax=Loigolactobacillus backii TaxID=375175 RepID=A0A192H264_9LACO|nr:hypothetical protein [Loigolactobacillus backii]ANK59539.1 hypothetical protein AYR52_04325 [Loigolactobacillus backii]ANK62899.1 hypothetical protein AYR53_09080 [Loigolactobacillus backii]ANK64533.1 hypothetical protein AYR54_04335 [Loigolactobacillus backii]ANK67071.1 hypothetical protein AYR55_04700 [Loigolactobacillus backii]ANK70093.1 hypothetical protein AYR56_07925 [Loigolactobacillus backii]